MKIKTKLSKKEPSPGLNRRMFIASALAGSSLLPLRSLQAANSQILAGAQSTAIDFDRSFCHCSPKQGSTWVRMQLESRCEVFDRASGASDEYFLGIRAQTGLHKEPSVDPGYDFWVIFS